MTERVVDFEAKMLEHAERQTKAIESINTYFMRLMAVLTVLAVVVIVAALVNR